ncbi:hypothetical protein N9C30_00390 [bacterium]|nr:hypothetical protein [bacterium]
MNALPDSGRNHVSGSGNLFKQFGWILGAAAVLVAMALVGGTTYTEAIALLASLVPQIVFGVGIWSYLSQRRQLAMVHMFSVGLVLGPLSLALLVLLLVTVGVSPSRLVLIAVLCGLGVVGAGAMIRSHMQGQRVEFSNRTEISVLVLAAGFALIASQRLWNDVDLPRTITGWGTIGGDAGVEEARANSIMELGLNDYLLAYGQPLKYHLLGHVWSGAMNISTNAAPFVVTTRVVPILTSMGALLLTWVWVRSLSNRGAPAFVAVFFVATAGIAGSLLGPIFAASFSQSWGAAIGALFVAMWWWGLQGLIKYWWLILGVVGFALALAKVNGVLLIAAATVGSLILIIRPSERNCRALAASLVASGSAAVAVLAFEFGYGNGLVLTSSQTAQYLRVSSFNGEELPYLIPTMLAAAFLLTPWLASANLMFSSSQLRPQILAFGGSLTVLALALTVFTGQSGQSQVYFSMIAGVAMIPLAAWGTAVAWGAIGKRRAAQAAALATTLVIAVVWAGTLISDVALKLIIATLIAVAGGLSISLLLFGVTRRISVSLGLGAAFLSTAVFISATLSWFRIDSGLLTRSTFDDSSPNGLSGEHIEAIEWLRERNQSLELVATNFVCSDPSQVPPDCLAINFPLAAIGSQPTLLEGFSYSAGMQVPAWALQRLELVESFVRQGSQTAGMELADLGVRWVFVDNRRTSRCNWEPVGEVVFQNDFATVLRLEYNN